MNLYAGHRTRISQELRESRHPFDLRVIPESQLTRGQPALGGHTRGLYDHEARPPRRTVMSHMSVGDFSVPTGFPNDQGRHDDSVGQREPIQLERRG